MSQEITKEHLDAALRDSTREIIEHLNRSQGAQNERLDAMAEDLASIKDDMAKVKLAVLDYLATDRAVRNLVRELKAQGITLDERKIFA